MSGKLDWSERCSWGNQPPTHASLRPSPSKKLVACTENETDKHTHTFTNTHKGLREISRGVGGLLQCNRLIQELSPERLRYRV